MKIATRESGRLDILFLVGDTYFVKQYQQVSGQKRKFA
jgi:hypothetical protein